MIIEEDNYIPNKVCFIAFFVFDFKQTQNVHPTINELLNHLFIETASITRSVIISSHRMFLLILLRMDNTVMGSIITINWAIRHIRPFPSVDTTSALALSLVLCNLDYWNSLINLFYLLLSIPYASSKVTLPNSSSSIPVSPALNAWSNCTGCPYTFVSSLNYLLSLIALIQSILTTIMTTLVHLPPPICTNQSIDHPSSTEVSPMHRLLSDATCPHSLSTDIRARQASAEDSFIS